MSLFVLKFLLTFSVAYYFPFLPSNIKLKYIGDLRLARSLSGPFRQPNVSLQQLGSLLLTALDEIVLFSARRPVFCRVSDGCKVLAGSPPIRQRWGPADAFGRTLGFLVALVRSDFSLASPLLPPGESFSGATALVARNRRSLISLSQCGSRQSSQWRTLGFPVLTGSAYRWFPGRVSNVQQRRGCGAPVLGVRASISAWSRRYCCHGTTFAFSLGRFLSDNTVYSSKTRIFRPHYFSSPEPLFASFWPSWTRQHGVLGVSSWSVGARMISKQRMKKSNYHYLRMK